MTLYQAYTPQPKKPTRKATDAAELECDSLEPVQWPEVLAELNRSGWSDKRLAETVDVSGSTLRGWKKEGSIPNFESGRKLLAILRRARNSAISSGGKEV